MTPTTIRTLVVGPVFGSKVQITRRTATIVALEPTLSKPHGVVCHKDRSAFTFVTRDPKLWLGKVVGVGRKRDGRRDGRIRQSNRRRRVQRNASVRTNRANCRRAAAQPCRRLGEGHHCHGVELPGEIVTANGHRWRFQGEQRNSRDSSGDVSVASPETTRSLSFFSISLSLYANRIP